MPLRMNMHKFVPIIFSILILLVISSACVTQSASNQTNPKDVGISPISQTTDSPFISFEDARQNLLIYRHDSTNGSAAVETIYTIHGTNVNMSGDAESWIFGVRISGITELLVYQQGGWIQIPWNASLPADQIDIDRIVSPGRLFSQNSAVILGNPPHTIPERRDLDLTQGIYTLTIMSDNATRILEFNATMGELIP